MAAISVSGLSKTYRGGKVRALDNVSLQVEAGEVLGLIGPNGAGKTTFMCCLLGLLRPEAGSIAYPEGSPEQMSVRRASAYLPERLAFPRWMTGRQFVLLHRGLAGLPAAGGGKDAEEALSRVGLEPQAWDRQLKKYSRGMLQRVGLAQAMVAHPKYLFLDEPSSGLDPTGIAFVRDLLSALRREGTTIVINSHQLEQLERICDRVAFIQKGRLETVQTLSAASEERVLHVRWSRAAPAPRREDLEAVAKEAGARLLDAEADGARFSVKDDAEATQLIARVAQAGMPVVEATREGARLERFFGGASA